MQQKYIILSMMISSLEQPRNGIDVDLLQIEDL